MIVEESKNVTIDFNSEFNPDFNPDEFTTDLHEDLYEYWLKIKGDKLMPCRRDFKPTDIPHILSMLILLNVTYDPLRFQVRLWGTESAKFSGKDITGIWVNDHKHERNEQQLGLSKEILERFGWIIEHKRPYYVKSNMDWVQNGRHKYSSLVLPFSDDQEKINILLTANHYY